MSPVLGVLALVWCLGATPAARAADGPDYFGTNVQTLGAAPQSLWPSMLGQLAAGGMDVDRIEVDWKDVEPAAPSGGKHTYHWGTADNLISLMAQQGLRAAPIFRFVPGWAQGTNADGTPAAKLPSGKTDEFPPSQYANFAAFLAAFAQRYGTGLVDGSGADKLGTFWRDHPALTPQPVVTYEIWNEVNLAQYAWNSTPDPAAYAALLHTIRPILRAEQPAALMVGDLAWQDTAADGTGVYPDYAAALGAAGGLQDLDAMGFHPYAPDADSIFTLVRRLRSELDAAGSPDLPIYANEAGLPADFTGPGIQFAADIPSDPNTLQFPSDGARASSLEFAGEALADSDCGVDEFLPYSISGDELTTDPIHEGFMGMIRKDGTPTKTIIGLQRASLRWRAHFGAGGDGIPPRLQICGAAASPGASLLTIPISVTGMGNGCVTMTDTYDGNPMESAVLQLVGTGGTLLGTARSDAYGHATACVPDPSMTYQAYAEIPKAGISGTVLCDVPRQGCPAGTTLTPVGRGTVSAIQATGWTAPAPTATPVPTPTAAQRQAAAAASCRWKLTVAVRKRSLVGAPKKSRVTIRPSLTCTAVPAGTAIRFSMSVHRKGKKTALQTRSVFLRTGAPKDVDLVGSLRTTDTIAITHAADPVTSVPRISTSIRIGAPKTGKR